MRKGLVYLALLMAGAQTAWGQSRANWWRDYRVADGLPENDCVSVSVGPHDRVWAGYAHAGVITGLDGYSITNISVPSAFFGRVYESPGHQLWVVSSNGLMEYRNEKWTEYPVPEIAATLRATNAGIGIPLYPVWTGHVLFLLPRGLMQLDVTDQGPVTSTLLSVGETKLERFLSMAKSARDDTIWIAGRRGLAHGAAPARALRRESEWSEFYPPDSLGAQNLSSVVEDPDGSITVVGESATNQQKMVLDFDGQNWTAQPVGNANIRLAWRGPDKTSWVATADALFRLEGEKNQSLVEENLAHQINDLAMEPGGSFWLATSDGLSRYSPPIWRVPEARDAPNAAVNSLVADAGGRMWAALPDGLAVLAGNHWVRYPYPDGTRPELAAGHVLYEMSDGLLVLPAGGGLLQFNRRSNVFSFAPPPARTRLRVIGQLRNGALCVQNEDPGPQGGTAPLQIFDGTNFAAFPHPQPPDTVGVGLLMFESSSSGLWLAGTKGIARYQDQKWQTIGLPDEKTPDHVSCLTEASDGRIWCAIRQTIWEYDGKSWVLSGGTAGKINALFAAHDGDLWAATDNGIYRFHRQTWVLNDTEDGLPSETVLSVGEDSAGRIWAGTARGPGLHAPEADPDPPYATIVMPANGNDSYSDNTRITFALTGVDKWKFTPAPLLEYSYQVDGKEWSQFRQNNTAPLGELPAGDHYFQVRGMDRNGNVAPTGTLYTFTVALPWYKEARLLLISSAGGIIIVFLAGLAINRHLRLVRSHAEVEAQVALRTKQLEMANQELLHSQKMNALGTLAAGIAHDFNSILSIIKGSAQIIEDNLDNPEKIRTRANRINTVVEQGAGIVKAMLGFSRGSGGAVVMCDINAIIGETVKLLGDRFLREVEVKFVPKADVPPVPASPDFVQQILLNLIFNAAEAMTERRQIILGATEAKMLPAAMVLHPPTVAQYVFISVQDFGTGIQPDILPRIFEPFFTTKSLSSRRGTGLGLSMVYELAKRMEAGLAVESVVNQGSTFTLILPVRDLPVDAEGKKE